MNWHDLWACTGAFAGAYAANVRRPQLSRAVEALTSQLRALAARVKKLEDAAAVPSSLITLEK